MWAESWKRLSNLYIIALHEPSNKLLHLYFVMVVLARVVMPALSIKLTSATGSGEQDAMLAEQMFHIIISNYLLMQQIIDSESDCIKCHLKQCFIYHNLF